MSRDKSKRFDHTSWDWNQLGAAALLVAMVVFAYAPLVQAGFIWDDDAYIVNNESLRTADGLRRIWFELGATPQYYPLVHTTYWIEYHLWRLNPLGYHLVNVLLHATSALLLWRLLLRLEVAGAWLAAAVFALHPVEVESVAWITERKNVLSLTLALAAILCYLQFSTRRENARNERRRAAWGWYILSLILFAGALCSKTVVASLPAVLLVIEYWKTGRIALRKVTPLVPFFAMGIGLGLVTVWMEKYHVGASGETWDLTWVERVLVAGRALWFYALKLVWPYPLIFFYPRWQIDASAYWQYLYPVAAVSLVIGLWLLRGRIGRGPLAAVLIFAGVLTPAIGFFNVYPFRYSFVADHFQYHASIALIALFVASLTLAAGRINWQYRELSNLAGAALLLGLLIVTLRQTFIYENLETLYGDTIRRNPEAWIAYTNLSQYLRGVNRLDDAMAVARKALELGSTEPTNHHNVGVFLFELGKRDGFQEGQLDEVISHYQTALTLDPNYAVARINYAHALLAQKRPDEAVQQLRQSLESNPPKHIAIMAHLDLGRIELERSDVSAADKEFNEALRLDPTSADALNGLGVIQMARGNVERAIKFFNEAVRVHPDDAAARLYLDRAIKAKWHGPQG